MKKMKNAFYIIVGGLMIIFSLKSIIIDGSEEYAKIIGLLIFGLIFIYPSLKKDSKTASENFIEEGNISVMKNLFIVLCLFHINGTQLRNGNLRFKNL